MFFDVKFDLRRKVRYKAGGHLISIPSSMIHSSLVSRESVRIAFLTVALNGFEVRATVIQNAYLNAPTKETIWFIAGDEWGEHTGKPVIIVRELYGLKNSDQTWRNFLAVVLKNTLGFTSNLADYDV